MKKFVKFLSFIVIMFLSFILFLEKNKISVFAATEILGIGVGEVFKLNSVYNAWQYYSFSFYDNDGNYLSNISGSAYDESDNIFTIDNDFSDYWVGS